MKSLLVVIVSIPHRTFSLFGALIISVKEAVKKAIAYTHLGIEVAQSLGKGHGPIDHFHSISPLLIPP